MKTFDQSVREELSRIVDDAPMAPVLADIETRARRGRNRTQAVFAVFAAAVLAIVGVAAWVNRGPSTEQIVTVDGPQAVQFGGPIELGLPGTVNTRLPMAVAGGALIVGHGSVSPESYSLEILAVDTPQASPRIIHTEAVGGLLLALEASGDRIVAVVSQHVTSAAPLLVVSSDGGGSWDTIELPVPAGVPLSEAAAVDAAIGEDSVVVVGPGGLWVSTDDVEWRYIDILGTDFASPAAWWDRLSEVTWTGREFVLAGGVVDPTSPDAGDHDLAFWRSGDGISWSGPEVLETDASLRTSGGAFHVVSDGDGRALSLTATQRWDEEGQPDALDRGTVVAMFDGAEFATTHLPNWILDDAFAVDGGFVAAGVRQDQPDQPRFVSIASDGSFADLGPAPGVSSIGLEWGEYVVVNGPTVESGSPNRTWVVPVGAGSIPTTITSGPTTVPRSDEVATTQLMPTTTGSPVEARDVMDVVGLDELTAVGLLTTAGFRVELATASGGDGPGGIVISTSPSGGSVADLGSTVVVEVGATTEGAVSTGEACDARLRFYNASGIDGLAGRATTDFSASRADDGVELLEPMNAPLWDGEVAWLVGPAAECAALHELDLPPAEVATTGELVDQWARLGIDATDFDEPDSDNSIVIVLGSNYGG